MGGLLRVQWVSGALRQPCSRPAVQRASARSPARG